MSNIKIEKILGSRRFSNYWWATATLLGGVSFFIAGLSSYLKVELLPFTNTSDLLFFPQGIVMIFYGTFAILISLFIWFTIICNIGGGYNEFNNDKGVITIFRLGFPGKNRRLELKYNINEVQSIKISVQEGLTPKREIYLKIKDKREIPLTRIGQPLKMSDVEEQATSLAKFLGVVLEGIQ